MPWFVKPFTLVVQQPDLCDRCGKNHAQQFHACPYAEEIDGDLEECNCCQECEGNCAQDI